MARRRNVTGSGASDEMEGTSVLFKGRTANSKQPTIYICKNYTCDEPLTDAGKLAGKMRELAANAVEASFLGPERKIALLQAVEQYGW